MVRKFALAAFAAVVGVAAAAKLTSGQHATHSNLLGLHDDCLPQPESQGAKGDRPTFTPAVAHSAR